MIRLVIFGSNSLLLAGLVGILDRQSHFQVVGSFLDELDPSFLGNCQADLLLLEQTPNENWCWLEQWMLTTDLKIVGILLIDSLTTKEISEYLRIGFKGFLPRLIDTDEIEKAIDAVMAGLIVIHPELATFEETHVAIAPSSQSSVYLTPRETEVLQLLGTGLDNKAIAEQLMISKHTVKFHISSIFSKLDVSSRTEAVILGLQRGSIELKA